MPRTTERRRRDGGGGVGFRRSDGGGGVGFRRSAFPRRTILNQSRNMVRREITSLRWAEGAGKGSDCNGWAGLLRSESAGDISMGNYSDYPIMIAIEFIDW